MSEIGKLWITITANTDEFNKGIQGVQQKAQNIGAGMTKAGGTLTKGLTVPLIAAGGAAFAMVSKVAGAGDEIQKMALRTGMSTESISELKHAADLSGASIETVEKAVKRMQKNLLDAENGMASATRGLEAVGLSAENLQGLSPEEQFNTIAMALAGIEDPSKRAALAQELFGRAGTELLPMLASGADGLAEMRQEAHDLGIVFSQEAADAAAKFNDDLDRLKKGFGGVFQELAMKLLPVFVDQLIPAIRDNIIPLVAKFADGLGKLMDWFNNLSPSMQKLVTGALGLLVVLGPVLMIVGKIISVFGPLIGIIGKVIAVVMKVVAVVKAAGGVIAALKLVFLALTGPIGIIIAIIAALAVAGYLIYKNWDKIKEFFAKLWEGIKTIFSAAWEFIKELFFKYHPLGWVIANWDGIKEWFSGLWDGVKNIFSGVWDWLKGFFAEWGPVILAILVPFIGLPMLIIQNWEVISAFLINLWNTIKEQAATIWETIKTAITEKIEALKTSLQTAWENIKTAVSNAWEAIKSAAISKAEELRQGIVNTINKAIDWLRGLPAQMLRIGRDIIMGLINGIKNAAGAVWDAVKGVAGGIVDTVKRVFKSSSPSKVFMEIGRDVGKGLELGMSQMQSNIGAAMHSLIPTPELSMAVSGGGGGVAVPAGGGGIINNFHIEKMQVRDEKDVEAIARELYRWQSRRGRGVN